ncbi:hypothetical protein C9374_014083 [Naegleria lovaniensis]|uniref:DH domain-containing protein n=1 Tax=Naegleria lovaniensis TaxID=51637 RepID=A0AA88GZY9_NAELO|nr:uncharacterized protein C9374_014083 [Naegleria lovaniensis]KAG2389523.1 hypothetical protein C9374_014083 [Naegleria lovaniensis]
MTQKRPGLNELFPELSPSSSSQQQQQHSPSLNKSPRHPHQPHSPPNDSSFQPSSSSPFLTNHHHHHQLNINSSQTSSYTSTNSSSLLENSIPPMSCELLGVVEEEEEFDDNTVDTATNMPTMMTSSSIPENDTLLENVVNNHESNHEMMMWKTNHHHLQDQVMIEVSTPRQMQKDLEQTVKRLEEFVEQDERAKQAMTTIQHYFFKRTVRKNLKKLFNMSKKRKHVINEIISTEKSYVSDLKTIMDVYYNPIIKKGIEARDNIASIFVNVEMIYNLNEKLYSRLLLAQEHQTRCENRLNEMVDQWVKSVRSGGNNTPPLGVTSPRRDTITSSHDTDSSSSHGTAVVSNQPNHSTNLPSNANALLTAVTDRNLHATGSSASSMSSESFSTETTPSTTTTQTSNTTTKNGKNKKKKDKKRTGTMKAYIKKLTFNRLPAILELQEQGSSSNGAGTGRSNSVSGSSTPPGQIKSFGGAFAEMAPFMRLYTEYINNFSQATEMLKDRRKKNQQLNLYLNKCKETREECRGLDIASFLILPVQRIPKYQLLLRELLKFTPKGHPDHGPLSAAHSTMIQVANHLNEMRRQKIAFTRVLDIKSRLTVLSLQLVNAMKNSPVENLIMKHNFNSIEQVKNSIIKPHRHFVNEVLVNVIREKVSPMKLQWLEKAINLDTPQTEPIQFESYLFNDYYLLIIKGVKNENKNGDDSAFVTLPSASATAMATDRSNYSVFLKTPRDTVSGLDFASMDEILGQKELTAPFIVQPFYLSMSDFSLDQKDPCALKCRDYISGAEFKVIFDSDDVRNEWYNNIIDKKNTEIQKLVKQMTEKHTKAKINVKEFHGSETARAREVEETEIHARQLAIAKFNKIAEFIQEKINIQNRFIKMKQDFETIKKTFDKEYDKYQTLKMILSRMKEQPDIYEKKQKQVLDYETEMVKTKTRLKDACDRLQKGEIVFKQMIDKTKDCDEVILMCLRNDIESLAAFFGDSQILDQPEIVDLSDVTKKMQYVETDLFYQEIEHKFPKSKQQPLSVSSQNLIINSSFHKAIPAIVAADSSFEEDTSSETGSTASNAQVLDDYDDDIVHSNNNTSGGTSQVKIPKLPIAKTTEETSKPSKISIDPLEQLKLKLENMEGKNKQLTEENNTLRSNIDNMVNELDILKNKLIDVTSKNEQLQNTNTELSVQNSELLNELEELRIFKNLHTLDSVPTKRRSQSVPIRLSMTTDPNDDEDNDQEPSSKKDNSPSTMNDNTQQEELEQTLSSEKKVLEVVATTSSIDLTKEPPQSSFNSDIPTTSSTTSKLEELEQLIAKLQEENRVLREQVSNKQTQQQTLENDNMKDKQQLELQIHNLKNSMDIAFVDSDFDTDEESHSPTNSSNSSNYGKPTISTNVGQGLSNTPLTRTGTLTRSSRIQEHVEKYEQLSRTNDTWVGRKKSKNTVDLTADEDSQNISIDNKILRITIHTIQYQLQLERLQHEQAKKSQNALREEVAVYKKKLDEANKTIEDMKRVIFVHMGLDIPKTPNN